LKQKKGLFTPFNTIANKLTQEELERRK